jgi:hypothetical protein
VRKYILPLVIEIVGITLVGAGIGFEAATGADLGYLVITTGSAFVAGGAIIWGKFMRGGGPGR